MRVSFSAYVLGVQGAYYLVMGLWATVDMESFMAVTGPKSDLWLVRTVGLLAMTMGAAMLTSAVLRRVGPEMLVLALGAIFSFTVVDVSYTVMGRIPPIYLADAAAEIILLGFWYYAYRSARQRARPEAEPYPAGSEFDQPRLH